MIRLSASDVTCTKWWLRTYVDDHEYARSHLYGTPEGRLDAMKFLHRILDRGGILPGEEERFDLLIPGRVA